jgi:hypothetical protein
MGFLKNRNPTGQDLLDEVLPNLEQADKDQNDFKEHVEHHETHGDHSF